ncbi:MAG TPA: hypothetical protein VFM21_00820 [Terriglobia bacterium]|nr:hypothetical protein [Terriglobia bacterium]
MQPAVKRANNLAVVLVLVHLGAAPAARAQRGPSTPDERERAVRVAHTLEVSPLDENLRADRQWAMTWLIEVPDIQVKLCPAVLGDFLKSKYKYSPEILAQLTLSMAAYGIEHPGQASDPVAQYLAGVEGVLKAYKAILQLKPKAKSAALDELVHRQEKGELKDAVRESAASCK